ncbi:unannotated protein [freshwater metagenome]|uniref:Unannotated protein n=1 Tax=freshwater metagenome TaxID=449393 RepID=A0A6J6HZN4_9ZZZZ
MVNYQAKNDEELSQTQGDNGSKHAGGVGNATNKSPFDAGGDERAGQDANREHQPVGQTLFSNDRTENGSGKNSDSHVGEVDEPASAVHKHETDGQEAVEEPREESTQNVGERKVESTNVHAGLPDLARVTGSDSAVFGWPPRLKAWTSSGWARRSLAFPS